MCRLSCVNGMPWSMNDLDWKWPWGSNIDIGGTLLIAHSHSFRLSSKTKTKKTFQISIARRYLLLPLTSQPSFRERNLISHFSRPRTISGGWESRRRRYQVRPDFVQLTVRTSRLVVGSAALGLDRWNKFLESDSPIFYLPFLAHFHANLILFISTIETRETLPRPSNPASSSLISRNRSDSIAENRISLSTLPSLVPSIKFHCSRDSFHRIRRKKHFFSFLFCVFAVDTKGEANLSMLGGGKFRVLQFDNAT